MGESLRLDDKIALDRAFQQWKLTHKNAQRFGQYLVNNHYHDARAQWTELFYEEDTAKAYSIALNHLAQK